MTGLDSLSLIPITGMAIYVGLISGYIPSFLYDRNERWPKQYAILQLFFLVATAARLTHSPYVYMETEDDDDYEYDQDLEDDDDYYEYNQDFEELTTFSHWLDADLNTWFYKFFQEDALGSAMELAAKLSYLGLAILLAKFVNCHEKLYKWDDSNLAPPMLFVRNLALFMAIDYLFICNCYFDPENNTAKFCEKQYNITPGFAPPDCPLTDIVKEFTDAWKEFHPSNLRLVRISHSILYPTILLLLTRRRLTTFLVWVLFLEIDFHHLLADMFHYVSAPALAEDRLEFQGGSHNCYVNVQFLRTMLSYPLNFVYLTTSMGDTSTPASQILVQSEHEL